MSGQSKRAKRLKHLCRLNPTKREVAHLPPDTEVSFLPMEKVSERGVLTLSETRSLTDVMNGFTYFRNGDVIVAKITPCFENGKGAECHSLANGIGFGSTEFHVLRPLPGVDSRFIFFLSCSQEFRHLGASLMYGAAGQQRVPEDFLANYEVLLPPLPEQRAIAAFLDRKTAQIDAVVAKKQRLIELLQEKRQALISHAVTKGLDPHAPMKDSGIPWLGEVPQHWTLKPLGSIVNIFGGSTPSKNNENYWTGGNIPWVSPKDMKRWEIDDSEDHITKDALVESGISLIRPPAILLVVRGMILARDVPVSITTVPVTINQDMKALVARPGCSAEFLGLLLRAVREAFFALVEESGHGTRCLRTELWRKLPLPIPPIEDQKAICAFVHSEVKRSTGIERRLVDQIAKLQEYRHTLISAAVTGKIDLTQERDW